MKEQKEQKEEMRKVREALAAPQTDQREDLDAPDDARYHKGQELVPVVELDQEKHHSQHNRHEEQILNQVGGDEVRDRQRVAEPAGELLGKIEHPFLGFPQREGHEGRAKEEQKGRPEKDADLGQELLPPGRRREGTAGLVATGGGVPAYFLQPLRLWVVDVSLAVTVSILARLIPGSTVVGREGQQPVQKDRVATDEAVPQEKLHEGLPEAHGVCRCQQDVLDIQIPLQPGMIVRKHQVGFCGRIRVLDG
mmetsp:Transcript_21774/g.51841  ORF Transcript_21774/g.51841 Transcript_21774/m.51841 type:complete len:251 (+) Transcript_21774:437-1189(+)